MKNIIKKNYLKLLCLCFLFLLPDVVFAGIIEDTIKKHNLDINKSEDRCRLSDYLNNSNYLKKTTENSINDYTEYEVCSGEKYEIKNQKVNVGSQGVKNNLAQCYLHDFSIFRIFRFSNMKIASVSRGYNGYYLIPVDFIYFSPNNKDVTLNKVSSNSFKNGFVIKTKTKPSSKISYYKIENCDIKVY